MMEDMVVHDAVGLSDMVLARTSIIFCRDNTLYSCVLFGGCWGRKECMHMLLGSNFVGTGDFILGVKGRQIQL